jgi:hypothetical protein
MCEKEERSFSLSFVHAERRKTSMACFFFRDHLFTFYPIQILFKKKKKIYVEKKGTLSKYSEGEI